MAIPRAEVVKRDKLYVRYGERLVGIVRGDDTQDACRILMYKERALPRLRPSYRVLRSSMASVDPEVLKQAHEQQVAQRRPGRDCVKWFQATWR